MEKKEFTFQGTVIYGFLMLFINLAVLILSFAAIIYGIIMIDEGTEGLGGIILTAGIILLITNIIMWCGFLLLEPNEARVITWFGKYSGTFTETGFFWINPFYSSKKLSLRARNLDAAPIKVNDKTG